MIDYLLWDSEFFGKRIARSRLNRLDEQSMPVLLAECRQEHIDCLYFLADSDDPQTIRLAEANAFRLVDVRVTLQRECKLPLTQPPLLPNGHVRAWQESDFPQLEEITRNSYTTTRFYNDPGFSRQDCDRLYATWMHNSTQDYAQAVFVAETDGQPKGFITCHHRPGQELGEIGLVGIAQAARRSGLGHLLVVTALEWFNQHGASQVSVVTQGANIAGQRLYQRCGFLTSRLQLWYHRWFN